MASFQMLRSSRHKLYEFVQQDSASLRPLLQQTLFRGQRRHASSTAPAPDKPIVFEQPDKFRPPSHPQKLVRGRARPNTFGSGYNQSSTHREQESQKSKRYPHTFPNEGTVMHKFLTNRTLHAFITLGTLVLLAGISLISTFRATSPFAHLLPPLSSLIWHPISFFTECGSIYKLDMDYRTERVFEERNFNMLDAKKRRLYRRAHGMEDLDRDEEQGVDIRGIAPWDDGLLKREREAGVADWQRKGPVPHQVTTAMLQQKKREAEEAAAREEAFREEEARRQSKRKLWFGIW